ncbi:MULTISPECIES: BPSL0067 family protein [Rhizobium]|nr:MULTISPECIES: BPSL0067 family protein [Rhizobium]
MAYLLQISEADVFGRGRFANAKGNTECVEFVRQATGAPQTASWHPGRRVMECGSDEIARGTAIATFADGKYNVTDDLGQHAAIYLSHSEAGIEVLDQWNKQGEVRQRTIRTGQSVTRRRSNRAECFYIIE